MKWDFFISHASEDKEEIARPLAEFLISKGYSVWYDEFTLLLGDSLRRKIEEGLKESNYGIVILSHNFFKKEWPQRELDGLNSIEIAGKKKIIPLWHKLTYNDVIKYSPTLADKIGVSSDKGLDFIYNQLKALVSPNETIEFEIKNNKDLKNYKSSTITENQVDNIFDSNIFKNNIIDNIIT